MDIAGRKESREVLGYSAFNLTEESYEYNENACYIADDVTTLRKFLSDAMLDVRNYRCDPVTIEDMQKDFGCSYGEFALEPRSLERFKRIAQALGVKHAVEPYKTVFDTQDGLFIVTLTRK